ncbi:hypothetical protein LTR78_004855 [Recurvomyces mirabilis]|uniref:Rhodopsin domain-containing protein n=1 Tax=Recurvomyces mirabilis TaxID=574656 RepID=A0AAE0WP03_9PEZI|nr:hypothetical protein LTR78_004855 [Recurvomyces mirabilis]
MTLMVLTRLWLRSRKQAGALGLDDIFLVPAFLAATMFTTLVVVANEHYGIDRHVWDVPPQWFSPGILIAWLSEIAFLVSSCSTKISVLLFYRRLTKGTISTRWKAATIGAIIFTVGYCLSLILALILTCQPTNSYWLSYSPTYEKPYHCVDTRSVNPLSGALSVFSDFYSVLLPMLMLRHFDIPHRQKTALYAVFSLGFLVVAAGCVRTYYIYKLGTDYDITWVGYHLFVYSVLELQLALICASAPALRVFFREYLSDPFTRAVNATRSASSGRGTNRGSAQVELGAVSFSSPGLRSSVGSSEFGAEKKLVQHRSEPLLETVGETDLETISLTDTTPRNGSESLPVRTPEDFEAYALKNLQRNRPPYHLKTKSRASEESTYYMEPALQKPFTDLYSPPSRG